MAAKAKEFALIADSVRHYYVGMGSFDKYSHHKLHFVNINANESIAWARSGRVGGPVMVRVANWMTHIHYEMQSPFHRPFIERMGRHFELLRFDVRGNGLSTSSQFVHNLDTFTEELEVVTKAHGAQKFVIFGVGGGGAAAIVFAARHPHLVSHLILLGAYAQGVLRSGVSAHERELLAAQAKVVELGWNHKSSFVQNMLTGQVLQEADSALYAALNEQQKLACNGAVAAGLLKANADLCVQPYVGLVQAPTLVLHSSDDPLVPFERGKALAASIPGARLEILQSRNHVPVATEPAFDRLCECIVEFVMPHAIALNLSKTERELCALVGQGFDNLQIAARLDLKEKSVRNKVSALYRTMGVEGRAQTIITARELEP
jgi:pimeloyl-ACP methyl ester carboxylesterase/DNA-binding CsgD family transcriptional regulator